MTSDELSEHAALENAAAGLREILRLARALGSVSEEGELFELISESTRDKLGCKVCAVAVRDDDGAFRYAASAGLAPRDDRLLRRQVLSGSDFEALRGAAVLSGAVWCIPAGHPVRACTEVVAAILAGTKSSSSRSAR